MSSSSTATALRPLVAAALGVLLLCTPPARAPLAEDAIGEVIDLDRSPDMTGTRDPVRSSQPVEPFSMKDALRLELVVDATGVVRSARAVGGPPDVYDAGVAEALTWRFVPTIRDGVPVAVRFTSSLMVLPPEILPETHVPFPEADPLDAVSISLLNMGCGINPCASFRIAIDGTGLVQFDGGRPLAARVDYRIPPERVEALVDAFRRTDFFSLRDSYELDVSDMPASTISITIGGMTKSILDGSGWAMGMPVALSRLEAEVVQAAMVPALMACGAEAVALLHVNGVDFADAADLLAGSVNCPDDTLFSALLDAGAPLTGVARFQGTIDALHFGFDDRWAALVAAALRRGAIGDRAVGLRMAIRASDPELARAFLAPPFGVAVLDARDQEGRTPLFAAATAGTPEMIRLLLDLGAARTVRDFKGNTALHVAGSVEAVRTLLAAGLDPDTPNDAGETLLRITRSASIAEALIAGGADLEQRDWRGRTPLMVAEGEIIPTLIAAGADVTARDKRGNTPLHFFQNVDFLPALVAAGADLDARNDAGRTPLLELVAEEEYPEYAFGTRNRVADLIEAGADVRAPDATGRTIRDYAVAFDWTDIVGAIDLPSAPPGP